jgi:protein-tyrosine phosphatase
MNDYLDSLKGKSEIRIEMVCLGNICRSPMAAAVLHNKALRIKSPKLIVTSSGTSGWHKGEGAHPLSQETWESAGYRFEHISRPFSVEIFDQVDLILPMDLTNRANILNGARNSQDRSKVFMLRSFDTSLAHIDPVSAQADALQVPDPWGETIAAYREVLVMIETATDGLITRLT